MSATATRPAAFSPPDPQGAARAADRWAGRLAGVAFWALVLAYVVVFCAISLRRYDAFLMHALDMGNMEQAVWNTFHGHPFRFTNMRAHVTVEAFGTDTRLSFHVEPILLPLSLVVALNLGPAALLIVQTVVLASGALPARRLVRRYLPGSALAEVVFPLAYLLFPAMEAANLYEFHAVTLTAALLLWALDFADEGRVGLFLVTALAATWCKEEIGLVVALLALWAMLRGSLSRRVGLGMAAFSTAWALAAALVIVPLAQHAQHSTVASSPYLTRYLSRNLTAPNAYVHVTVGDVLRYWAAHPAELAGVMFAPAKWGFTHRLLVPMSYLSLLSPLTLLVSLPSFLLIDLSRDQHMYGGLAHYSAEFVGIVVAAAILGLARLARWGQRLGLPPRAVVLGGSLVLLVVSLANQRVNGFSPLGDSFEWPALTPHVRLGQRMLALIPPDAPVSAQDTLDPHLSDRAGIYLFPDITGAQYIALDASASPIPAMPTDLRSSVEALLASRRWDVLFADDGYLLLRQRAAPARTAPVLPPAFYTFVLPAHPAMAHQLRVSAGGGLEMLGYTITRREVVNLRSPDVVLTTYWRVARPLTRSLALTMYLTGVDGRLRDLFMDQSALDWLPISSWRPGQIVAVSSTSMGIGVTSPGQIAACVAVRQAEAIPGPGVPPWRDPGRLPLQVEMGGADAPYMLTAGGQALCVGRIPVMF